MDMGPEVLGSFWSRDLSKLVGMALSHERVSMHPLMTRWRGWRWKLSNFFIHLFFEYKLSLILFDWAQNFRFLQFIFFKITFAQTNYGATVQRYHSKDLKYPYEA